MASYPSAFCWLPLRAIETQCRYKQALYRDSTDDDTANTQRLRLFEQRLTCGCHDADSFAEDAAAQDAKKMRNCE